MAGVIGCYWWENKVISRDDIKLEQVTLKICCEICCENGYRRNISHILFPFTVHTPCLSVVITSVEKYASKMIGNVIFNPIMT